jgi:hypothetical protein
MDNPELQLAGFIAKYTPEIAAQAEAIRNRMRKLYPSALELVYDNYNALAIGYGPTEKASEAIFSVALFPRWVSLFFLQGKGLPDPHRLLKGSGNVAKHVVLSSPDMLNEPDTRADGRGGGAGQSSFRSCESASPHHQGHFRQATPAPSGLHR